MANRIKKFMDDWKETDNLMVAQAGGDPDVLKDRKYMKQKFRETRAFIRQNSKGLSPQEKRWMLILKVGNRHLEKKLYPNPLIRYGRKGFNSLAVLLFPGQRKKYWDGDIAPKPVKYIPQANKQQAPKPVKKAVPAITKLVPKNKYAAVDNIKKSKGLSVH